MAACAVSLRKASVWINVPPEKVRAALKTAISDGRSFTTEEWEKEMNIKKPPELLKVKIISLSEDVDAQLQDGFGAAADGEDRFDAFCGACGMIEIANGSRAAGAPDDPDIRNFEGWILGQKAEDILSG
jgi:hypothetical protein